MAQRKCEHCQQDLNQGKRFCSKGCYQSYLISNPPNGKKFKKGIVPWNKDHGVKKECKECGKEFKVSPCRKDTAFYCSKKCKAQNKKLEISLQQRKIKKELWKEKIANGYKLITPENKLERARFRQTAQKQVFERDDYTCQMCGERGGKLQADHIQPWAEYVDGRFDINNCRTLCMTCHYKITFGRELPESVSAWGHNFSQIGGQDYF